MLKCAVSPPSATGRNADVNQELSQWRLWPTSSPFSRNTDAEAFTWPCVGLAGAKGPVDNTKIFQENIGVFLKTKYPCVHARD